MADDLVASHLPTGTTRNQVVALLGDPDPSYGGAYQGTRTLAFDMGGWMDTNWLVVEFDDDWLLTKAFWYQD
jgi:outer membrane protein assembly factor BamE (lipoprotein component of BamABCDE complex)